jgi:hypothetical protein
MKENKHIVARFVEELSLGFFQQFGALPLTGDILSAFVQRQKTPA